VRVLHRAAESSERSLHLEADLVSFPSLTKEWKVTFVRNSKIVHVKSS
jgi:hypothetical protein